MVIHKAKVIIFSFYYTACDRICHSPKLYWPHTHLKEAYVTEFITDENFPCSQVEFDKRFSPNTPVETTSSR
jgi:hypothetical protein